jgi:hypothetical protein
MRIAAVMATVRLAGAKNNRDGVGGVIRVKISLGKQSSTVHSGSGYCSQSDLVPPHSSKSIGRVGSNRTSEPRPPIGFLPLMKAGA